ncbi:hypothetical protein DPMN_013293 [Dreissena polymorpha]|uniref:Uncharacterized protein n=1 Tax=Dreissena polymorpha TaxID=45954 RepID=A0A9D4N9N2_DREPO|nr:hypothetical protein DPMN_013293 [Dreissena polymorpha]
MSHHLHAHQQISTPTPTSTLAHRLPHIIAANIQHNLTSNGACAIVSPPVFVTGAMSMSSMIEGLYPVLDVVKY